MDETSVPRPAPSPDGTPARHERGWHLVAVSTGSLAPPIGLAVLHPVVGEVFAAVELAVLLVVFGTALFGSEVLSDRAFRLLRWLGNRPEPWAPQERQDDGWPPPRRVTRARKPGNAHRGRVSRRLHHRAMSLPASPRPLPASKMTASSR
jgi:hypothetical protein